jgi:hypothetical protein
MENHPTDSVQALSQLLKLPEELPTELWIEVIEGMEPRDVLSLSAVGNPFALSATILNASCRYAAPFTQRYAEGISGSPFSAPFVGVKDCFNYRTPSIRWISQRSKERHWALIDGSG